MNKEDINMHGISHFIPAPLCDYKSQRPHMNITSWYGVYYPIEAEWRIYVSVN